jgi:nitrate/nitrite transporter NarK
VLLGSDALTLVVYIILGFCCGPVWAMILAEGSDSFRESSGTVTGFLVASGGLGGAVFPIIMGAIIEFWGWTPAFLMLILSSLLGFVLMLRVIQVKREK